jgi:hypothetical protein
MVPISLVPVLALMYFYISTFRSLCAVPNMAVFCSSLTSWFPGMVLTYFPNDYYYYYSITPQKILHCFDSWYSSAFSRT